ncbi:MAG: hypothetical protein E7528_02985 [Ruminococcaceae bacterium]|nr:hypothetical protein [Oscillospiraceae bacterium]
MKKFTKAISTLLVVALVVAMATVSTFATDVEAVSISVVSGPDKTVYYEGLDSYENEIWCDATGMVLEVTFSDSSTELITVDEYSYVDMYVVDYVIGENEAIVEFYGTDDYDAYLETTYTVTVEESPVESVEVTKMPTKTEYDMEEDVFTRDNFTLDYLYESDPETMDEMLNDMGMTFEEMKAFYEENPEYYEMILDIVFSDFDTILNLDTEGMEILVTFKDGTTETVTSDEDYITYNGGEYPIYVEQLDEVTEGENKFVVNVMGAETEFVVNVVSANDNNNNNDTNNDTNNENNNTKPDTDKNDNKNPVIPNTDGGVSVVASAVIALASGFGIALIPSKKEK